MQDTKRDERYDGPIAPKGDSTETDFSNPHHLGFMRFAMFLIIIETVAVMFSLASLTKSQWNLSAEYVLMIVNMLINAVTFWLLWNRRKHARGIIIALSAFNIAISVAYNVSAGSFSIANQLLLSSLDIVFVLYFATSRRAKAVLVRPWNKRERERAIEGDASLFRPRKLEYWRNLAVYFCVFSVVGHWMEAGYCTLIRFGIVPGKYDPTSQIWSDWLYPFMVYGFGFVACALLLFPLKNWLQKKIKAPIVPFLASFAANAALCTAIEFAMGMMLNQPLPDGSLPLWDYRDMAFNFMGQVCLANAIAFGVAASVITWFVYPAIERVARRAPKDAMRIVSVVVFLGFAFLLALYYVNVSGADDAGGGSQAVQEAPAASQEADAASSSSASSATGQAPDVAGANAAGAESAAGASATGTADANTEAANAAGTSSTLAS